MTRLTRFYCYYRTKLLKKESQWYKTRMGFNCRLKKFFIEFKD